MALEIDLSGRVALVTGGSRGLGRADALTLARAGADVVIADIQVESDAGEDVDRYGPLAQAARAQGLVFSEATAQEIQGMGRRAAAIKCDVTDRTQVDATVARAVEEFGSVDILVNMASVAGTLGGFGQASYSTTKAGLIGLTKTLALEGARHGITSNAIVPGIIGTEAFAFGNAEMNERMIRRTAMRRPGEPQEVANAIAFLCSDLASYITGVGLNVSGGIELFTF